MPELVEKAKSLRVSVGTDPKADLGPLISAESKKRVIELVQSGVTEGAELLLNGLDAKVNKLALERSPLQVSFMLYD